MINDQPDRSKREDLDYCKDFEIIEDAIESTHSDRCGWKYDDGNCVELCVDLRNFLQRYKKRYSEHWR